MTLVTRLRTRFANNLFSSALPAKYLTYLGLLGYALTVVSAVISSAVETAALAVISTDLFLSGVLLHRIREFIRGYSHTPAPVFVTVARAHAEAEDDEDDDNEDDDNETDEDEANEDEDEEEQAERHSSN